MTSLVFILSPHFTGAFGAWRDFNDYYCKTTDDNEYWTARRYAEEEYLTGVTSLNAGMERRSQELSIKELNELYVQPSDGWVTVDVVGRMAECLHEIGIDPDSVATFNPKAKEVLSYDMEKLMVVAPGLAKYVTLSEESIPSGNGANSIPQSGCLIATAAYGSEFAPQVQMLREIRDNHLLKTSSGSAFMSAFNSVYYSFSPQVADYERQNPVFKEAVKVAITPLISTLSVLTYVSMDSETEALGYGIGIILLNVGIYFVGPVFATVITYRKLKTLGKDRE